jgi:hypothetical protein
MMTLQKPNKQATTRRAGAHHDHGVGAKGGATLQLPKWVSLGHAPDWHLTTRGPSPLNIIKLKK